MAGVKNRQERQSTRVFASLSVFQPISEQLGMAAPGYLHSITQMSSHFLAQVRITVEPGMQI